MRVPKITLKAARINAGFTQNKAAERLGISTETLANYEKGKSFPDVLMLKKIEKLYAIDYDNLIFFA